MTQSMKTEILDVLRKTHGDGMATERLDDIADMIDKRVMAHRETTEVPFDPLNYDRVLEILKQTHTSGGLCHYPVPEIAKMIAGLPKPADHSGKPEPLTMEKYQRQAREFAIYPEKINAMIERMTTNELRRLLYLLYSVIGLCGEAGELANETKKMLRDDGVMTTERLTKLIAELGDVGWYQADVASNLMIGLEGVMLINLDRLQNRKDKGLLQGGNRPNGQ